MIIGASGLQFFNPVGAANTLTRDTAVSSISSRPPGHIPRSAGGLAGLRPGLGLETVVALQDRGADEPVDDSNDDDPLALSDEEQARLDDLKKRDAEVRRHEAAHAAAGGAYAGAPSFEYETGPDGRRYAVAGEVPIDAAAVPGDPAATIEKMETVKAAALAPAEPSRQDRTVAAQAEAKRRAAEAELSSKPQSGNEASDASSRNGAGAPEAIRVDVTA